MGGDLEKISSATNGMTTEVHPIQAAVPSSAFTTFTSSCREERYCGINACLFAVPCYHMDKRTVYEFDGPPELKAAAKKLQDLGIVPTVIFPRDSVAAEGEMGMTRSLSYKKTQNSIMEGILEKEGLERFHHVLFETVPDYKPSVLAKMLHYCFSIPRTLMNYTVYLPCTICYSDEWNEEQIKEYIFEFIDVTVARSTEPNSRARQFAGKLFAAGCWDGPTLIHHLAPLVNEDVNKAWINVEQNAYLADKRSQVILSTLIKSSGWTKELKMVMLLVTKCLIVRTCLENCHNFSEAWDSNGALSAIKSVATWVVSRLD